MISAATEITRARPQEVLAVQILQVTAHEEPVLRRYQRELNRHGIPYSWEMLCEDYRLSLSYMLFDTVWNATAGSSPDYWKPKLQCLVAAYQDWQCAENLAS